VIGTLKEQLIDEHESQDFDLAWWERRIQEWKERCASEDGITVAQFERHLDQCETAWTGSDGTPRLLSY
jgi:hypothetical protein